MAVSLLCTEVSSRPAVPVVGKSVVCDCVGCPASKGPCCLSPFPSQDLAPGLSLAGSRKQVSSQSCSTQRAQNGARNFHHLETELGMGWLLQQRLKSAGGKAHRRQPPTPHRLQAGCPGQVLLTPHRLQAGFQAGCRPLLTDCRLDVQAGCRSLLTDCRLDVQARCRPLLTACRLDVQARCHPLLTACRLDVQAGCPPAGFRWGLCQALFLTRSSHSRCSEGPLGSPFIRALISFMRAPPP